MFSCDLTPHGKSRKVYTLREPLLGVISAITPFNHPLNQVIHKVAPSVATNNRMVLKPSEKTPLAAFTLADILYEAGLPPEMLTVVTGDPKEIADEMLTTTSVHGGGSVARPSSRRPASKLCPDAKKHGGRPMDTQRPGYPLAVYARLVDAQNAQDLDAMLECFDPAYRSEQPPHPARAFTGTDQVRKNWSALLAAVPDFHADVLRTAATADTVWAVLYAGRGPRRMAPRSRR